MNEALEDLSRRLARLATHYDFIGQWPEQSIDHLTRAGAWTWIIPRNYGGLELDAADQLSAYEAVAAGCMSTLLVLTQRDGACEFIAACDNEPLKQEWLPRLAANEAMISVGISQLTTSHQSGRPAMTASEDGDAFILNGFMPWVTAARYSQAVVTGAVFGDERQLLALLPLDAPGVTIDPPMKLMALESSQTSEIHCKHVRLERGLVLKGPCERVLESRSTVKSLVVATAGIGHAEAMTRLIQTRAAHASPRLVEFAEESRARCDAVRERIFKYADSLHLSDVSVPKTEIRIAVNDLLIRLAVTLLTFAKGSGLLRQRDAQRLVREAMFFLVWSAPEDVRVGTLSRLLTEAEPTPQTLPIE